MFLMTGCVQDSAPQLCRAEPLSLPVGLVDVTRFQLLSDADDPFDDLHQDRTRCPAPSVQIELVSGTRTLEINTTDCARATLSQPALVGLCAGDVVELKIFHLALSASDEAHQIHLAVGQERLGALSVETPAETTFLTERFEVGRDQPEGTPVFFHLSNHGSNTWNIQNIDLVSAE